MTDHAKALRAAQAAVDAARPGWMAVLAERRRAVLAAIEDGWEVKDVAAGLGKSLNVVYQILGPKKKAAK